MLFIGMKEIEDPDFLILYIAKLKKTPFLLLTYLKIGL